MTDDDTAPDHTTDPREQGTGSGGYPESNPESATEGPGATEATGDTDGDTTTDAPGTSSDKEADRDASTGNPDAAG